MKIIIPLIFFISLSYLSKAQSSPFQIGAELVTANRYLKALDTVVALKKNFAIKHPDKIKMPNEFDQALSFFSSTVGEEYTLKWAPRKRTYPVSSHRFLPAYAYISEAIKDRQVVMINEDHNSPKHRVFTANLLDEFYKKGFRYLCLEGLDEDSLINERGYPDFESGFYVCEPNMANLIRKAKKIGFKLVSYDYDDGEEYANEHYGQNIREFNQAKNIQAILLHDPKAKILVHAGPGHIWEKGGDIIFMAEYFKMLTGIDPLTINQSVNALKEHANEMQGLLKDKPYVVTDVAGKPVVSDFDHIGDYDILIAWSPGELTFGRPNAILGKSGTKIFKFELPKLATGKLLQILGNKVSGPIPIDQFLVKEGVSTWGSALEDGDYTMQVIDINGKKLWQKEIKIQAQMEN